MRLTEHEMPVLKKASETLWTIESPMLRRPLKAEERTLVQYLVSLIPNNTKQYILPEYVVELDDGGMGSIRFALDKVSTFGRDLIQVKYLDIDNTLVIITLTEDNHHNLFELEMWKVDFSGLKQYPTPHKISMSL